MIVIGDWQLGVGAPSPHNCAEKRGPDVARESFHSVEAASGVILGLVTRVGQGVAWVGCRTRLYKGREQPVGSWSLGDGTKCHSIHIMNLLSVTKGAPLACGQHGLEWPQAPAYSSDLIAVQFSRLLLESPLPGPSCLVWCWWATWVSHLFGRNSWILTQVAPLGFEGPGTYQKHWAASRPSSREHFSELHISQCARTQRLAVWSGSWDLPSVVSEWCVMAFLCLFEKQHDVCFMGEGWCREEALCNSWLGLR